VLLEREPELEAIAAAVQAAKGGRGSIVLVSGPAGIGKTAVLAAAHATLTVDELDRALLLARTGVVLDDPVATRGNLLAALLRVPHGSLGVLPDVRDNAIYGIALSPRGDRIAIGDHVGEVRLFDVRTRRELGSYRLRPGLVQRLAFSPDGAMLAVAGQEPENEPPRCADRRARRAHARAPAADRPATAAGRRHRRREPGVHRPTGAGSPSSSSRSRTSRRPCSASTSTGPRWSPPVPLPRQRVRPCLLERPPPPVRDE
jgi:hypothetical protein